MKLILRICLVTTALCLAACSTSKIMGDGVTDLTMHITVANDANPDDNGRASPVYLQVLELRDTANFRNASYIDLYRDARGELGGAYLGTTEIGPLYPGSGRVEELRLNTAAGAVGVIGEFNRYNDMATQVIFEFEPGKDAEVKIRIDGKGIHVD